MITTCIWLLDETLDEIEHPPLDEDIRTVATLFSNLEIPQFTGTTTDLSTLIKTTYSIEISPIALGKKLAHYHTELQELGYIYESTRSSTARTITIKRKFINDK